MVALTYHDHEKLACELRQTHSFVRPRRRHSSVPTAVQLGCRVERRSRMAAIWRPPEGLVLDGREHGGKLNGSGRKIAPTAEVTQLQASRSRYPYRWREAEVGSAIGKRENGTIDLCAHAQPPTSSWSDPMASARPPWRETSRTRPSSTATPSSSPPPAGCSATSPPSTAIPPCAAGCAITRRPACWSSTRSATSPTQTATPTCCSS
jgi:hypothetical protein